jgi:16S rRNA (cytidine1402-2'-O)-methyltransferase
VLFESPSRLADALADVAAVMGDRQVVVARELTKRFEEARRGLAGELAQEFAIEGVKGEIVLIVAPPSARDASDAEIEVALRRELASESLRDAARIVADELGAPRTRVYQIGLRLKETPT